MVLRISTASHSRCSLKTGWASAAYSCSGRASTLGRRASPGRPTGPASGGGPASAATHGVSEVDFNFVPATVTIGVGDTVTWTNNATDPHTSTSDTGIWDSGSMSPGATFSHTFNSAGSFAYHCTFHQSLGMVGTVIVQ